VTFLLLIKKILTTHVANKEGTSLLTMINQITLTTMMTAETSTKTKGKLFFVS